MCAPPTSTRRAVRDVRNVDTPLLFGERTRPGTELSHTSRAEQGRNRPDQLLGGVPLEVRRSGTQEFRTVAELPKSVIARIAQQGADALATRFGRVRTAAVVMVNGQRISGVISPLADGAHVPLVRQHLGVPPAGHPVQRLALAILSAASAVTLQTIRGAGEPGEHARVKPNEAGAALLLAPLVPICRLSLAPVRQRSQIAAYIALPIVARTQALAYVLPRAAGEFALPGLQRRAAVHTKCRPRACVSVALPPLVVHRAPPPGAYADRAIAAPDGAGKPVHSIPPEMPFTNPK